MSNLLRVCLYNTEPEASLDLEKACEQVNFVRLVAEVDNAEDLATAIREAEVNLVFFHLDPDPDPVIEVIDQASARYPDLAFIALSHQANPEAILKPIRAGCDQFVCEPIDVSDLAAAVGRAASKRLFGQPKSRCICVTGASGGSGATSIACNLALEIGQLTERDCALVDLDLQFGGVALNFDEEPKFTLADLIEAGAELDHSILTSTITTLPCKVAILSRPERLEQQELLTPETVHRIIELLMGTYENIVVDVPSALNATTAAAFSRADLIIITCQLLVPSIRNAKRYHDALLRLGIPEDRLEVVINRHDGRSVRVSVKDLEETLRKPVFGLVPNDYQFVARSIDFGRPISSLDQSSPVRAAIRKIAKHIISGSTPDKPETGDRRGFLSRLLAK